MSLDIRAIGVDANGNRSYQITGLPGAPKKILGIKHYVREPGVAWSGPPLAPSNRAVVGDSVLVFTDAGLITFLVQQMPPDGRLIGKVTHLNNTRERWQVDGIRLRDLVEVPSLDDVHLVVKA